MTSLVRQGSDFVVLVIRWCKGLGSGGRVVMVVVLCVGLVVRGKWATVWVKLTV